MNFEAFPFLCFLENLVIAWMLNRNLYARRPFNAYFWRTCQGYEIELVLESTQTKELWGFKSHRVRGLFFKGV